ncbi:glycine--tRNA ligase subunit beta [Boseongicola aestuarii]|uniref:Glycine--tRNA ligase beta subunit n=1 Tax=Boseongicola aestuarii TaxID=1470561 RepID=A0A238J3P5_9RHOB|nr:glycine--tRNA ligase subunit beta [Boseongicola aestuarii]SMX24852.1 Glycine--tRNA ligase beta subunit [Boseongicola aestuarii]
MPDLLIELFSEEIPAKMQSRAADDLKRLMTDALVEAGLTYESAGAFATPRRLVLSVEGLLAESPTVHEERKGPRTDAPEKALEGFLRSTGLTKEQLEARDDKKGQVWFAKIEKPGRTASEIIAETLEKTVRNFPWPKSMRWGAGSMRWVRPLHSIVCILSENGETDIVDLNIDGITSSDMTSGHRFLSPVRFSVASFEDYAAKLKRAHVILSAEQRMETIWHDATQAAFANGLEVVEDKGLLAEVAGLVEWPVVLMGAIAEDFLDLPPEVLQTSMKEHQKFFSVRDKSGRITHFITVSNVETDDHGATIIAGNKKVLSARLADAKFFWENDLRKVAQIGMTGLGEPLSQVTFHNKLGTVAEKVDRIAVLAREIAPIVGAKPDLAEEAARLVKADLASEMVYEFPELQGTMGKYYAQAAGHNDGVPEACEEHYQPLGPSDDVPTHPVSVAVALADKIDTLTGFWAIDEKPTGSKDPFALRRAALGVIRLVLENNTRIQVGRVFRKTTYDLLLERSNLRGTDLEFHKFVGERLDFSVAVSLHDTSAAARAAFASSTGDSSDTFDLYYELLARIDETFANLLAFLHDRLKVYLRDRDIRHDVIDAALAMPGADDLTLLVNRATALQSFLATDDGTNLIQGFKRAHNILRQAEEKDGVEYSFGPDTKLAETPEETALFAALDSAEAAITPAMEAEDFAAAMSALAGLRAPIDAFFEAVQVNAESAILRRNRLNLLHRISAACLAVVDLTRIEAS